VTRGELAERLRRADATLDVPRPDWPALLERARRVARMRRLVAIGLGSALFAGLVAGGLALRAALGDGDDRPPAARTDTVPGTTPETTPSVPGTTPGTTPSVPGTTPRTTPTTPPTVPARPDLAGEVRRGILVVRNDGDAPAGPFRVVAGEETLIDSAGLAPGQPAFGKVPTDAPCPAPPARIDPDDAVAESDEDDNSVELPCVPVPPTTPTQPPVG
jgi:hypothetical protein